MANSNSARRSAKPAKPYPDFPLFPHASGRWAKKICGKFHYFGKWDDWQAALELYQQQRDYLHAGKTPPASFEGLSVAELANHFLTAKKRQLEAGDIVQRTFAEYHSTCGTIVDQFGKRRTVEDLSVADFEALRASVSKTVGSVRLGNVVQRIRSVFKYGYDAGLIDKPVRFGPTFKRPSKKVLRAERQKKGPRMFEAAELQQILKKADLPLHTMILLGINCGFGNHDCGTLTLASLDLKGGWIDFPRPKTAVERRCPLWPETIQALQVALESRPTAKNEEEDQLVFLTKYGAPWAKQIDDNPVSKAFRKLLDKLDLYRPGLGFYAIRHTFETVAGESKDQVAVNHIMGHADPTMSAHYRERISDHRLQNCVQFVHDWLYQTS